jgi:large repetitive protein
VTNSLLRIAEAPRSRRPRLLAGLTVVALLLLALPGIASADRGFTPRFSTNDTGNITIAANTLMTCPASAANCTSGQTSGGQNNNSFNMGYVDVDNDATTFDSSSSKLKLPAGATVLFAGLYWGADTSAGTNGTAAREPSANGKVLLKVPGASAYTTLGPTGTVIDNGTGTSTNRYQGFIDVTSLVKAAGAGTYTTANVQAGTGADRYAGWSLVVAYRDTSMPPRNLTIFDGYKTISSNEAPTSISLSGFTTPPAGSVNTTLGFVSYEGDSGLVGDSASLNGTTLSDALNPANNFFNSTISERGVDSNEREPKYANQYGFDADLVGADGILKNSASSATIGLTTSGDAYYPGVVTFATELYAPNIKSTNAVKDITHPGGPVQRGDELEYTVEYENAGQDEADQLIARDNIPTGTTYKAGSLRILTGPNAGARTDAAADDQAEYEAENRRVTFRLGTGANATAGGSLAPAASTSFNFRVTVNADVLDKATITGQATARFFGHSLGTSLSNTSPAASVTVAAPDLTLTNTHAPEFVGGATSITKLVVKDSGTLATPAGTAVTVTDNFPSSAFQSVVPKPSSGWTCNVVGTEVTCTRSDSLASGATYPPIEIEARVAPQAPASISNTAKVSGGADSDTSNNSATDVGSGTNLADLQLTGTTPNSTVASGKVATFEFTVRNGGPSVAHGIVFEDLLPSGEWQNAKATVAGGTCTAAVKCTIAELASGAEAKIKVEATVVANNKEVTNTATVSAGDPTDPTPENNSASVKIKVPNTADLSVTASASPEHPQPGVAGGLTYTVTLKNGGPGDASAVTVVDTLPEQFTPTTISAPGFTCNTPAKGGILTCTKATFTFAAGPQTITITGTVDASAAATQLFNVVRARAETLDPNGENNSAQTVTVSAAAVDLEMITEGPGARIPIGSEGAYKLTVKNNGPGASSATTVTGEIPAGLEYVSGSSNCSYASATRIVTCTVGALANGESKLSEIKLKPLPGSEGKSIETKFTVAAPPSDPVPTNNSSADTFLVTAQANLSLSASLSPTIPSAGQTATLTLTAKNAGPNAATGVTVVDEVPAGFEIVQPLPGNCALSGLRITCTLVGVEPNSEQTIAIGLIPTAAQAGQTATNKATISSTSIDPTPGDNIATTEIAVAAPDLEMLVEAPTAPVPLGGEGTVKLTVKNNGPGNSAATTITGIVPAGLEFVSATTGCTYAALSREVTCTVGALEAGQSQAFEVKLRPLPGSEGKTIETAFTVVSPTSDPVSTNNTGGGGFEVKARADLTLTATLSPAKPAVGQTTTLTLNVHNSGPNAATGVTVTDEVPAGFEIVQPLPAGCTLSGRTITCVLGTIAAGADKSVAIQLIPTAATGGQTATNKASLSSTSEDPNPGDDVTGTEIAVSAPEASGGGGEPGAGTNPGTGTNPGGTNPGTGGERGGKKTNPKGGGNGNGGGGQGGNGSNGAGGAKGANGSSGLLKVKMKPNKKSVRAGGTFRYKITLRTVGKITVNKIRVCTRIPRKLTLVGARKAKITHHRRLVCWKLKKLGPHQHKRFILKVKVKPTARNKVAAKAKVKAANAPKRSARAHKVKLLPFTLPPA